MAVTCAMMGGLVVHPMVDVSLYKLKVEDEVALSEETVVVATFLVREVDIVNMAEALPKNIRVMGIVPTHVQIARKGEVRPDMLIRQSHSQWGKD